MYMYVAHPLVHRTHDSCCNCCCPQVLIERFVSDDTQLQISTLYATQTFCHQNNFPKGIVFMHGTGKNESIVGAGRCQSYITIAFIHIIKLS